MASEGSATIGIGAGEASSNDGAPDAAPSWRLRTQRWWFLLAAATCALVVWSDSVDPGFALPNALQIATSLGALLVGARLLHLTTDRAFGSRVVLVAGCWLWFAGDASFLIAGGIEGLDGWSRYGELVYLSAQAAWAASVLMVLRRTAALSSARRVADGILIGITIGFAIWTLSDGVTMSLERASLGIATLVVDGTLVAGGVMLLIGMVGVQYRIYALFLASHLLLLASDAMYIYSDLMTSQLSIWMLDVGWSAAAIVRAAAMWFVGSAVFAKRVKRSQDRHAQWLLPAALAAVGLVVLARPPGEWSAVSVSFVVALLAAVVAREVLVAWHTGVLAGIAGRASDELRRRVERDPLTGLFSREPLFERVDDALAHRNRVETPGLLYLDLDGFKGVNDTFGHQAGDQLLQGIATRLGEIAGPDDLVARIGGDEFVVFRPDIGTATDAQAFAEDVRRHLAVPYAVADVPIRITASVGWARDDGVVGGADELLILADRAVYQAKRSGRNRATGSQSTVSVAPDVHRASEAVAALGRGELTCWYQPIVALESGRIFGAEASARWTDSTGQHQTTTDLLALLHAAGHAVDVTDQVLAQGCAAFASGPPSTAHWVLSARLSSADVADPSLADRVAAHLARSGLPAARLQLGIHRTAVDASVVDRLREIGVRVALEDADAGSATFNQLLELAPTVVTLDPTLLADRRGSQRAGSEQVAGDQIWWTARRNLIGAFIRAAQQLPTTILATGVEHAAQRTMLLELGCDLGQGPLWSDSLRFDGLLALAGSGVLPPVQVNGSA